MSSCGRLFDAVAAALGICRGQASYEGQAAIELEACVDEQALERDVGYPVRDRFGPLRLASLSRNAGEGAERSKAGEGNAAGHTRQPADVGGVASGSRLPHAGADHAARFHRGLANAVVEMAARLALGIETAVLSGGAFQNRILLELVIEGRRSRGFRAPAPRQVPANDSGLSLGQAVIAAARWLNSGEVPPGA